MEIIKAKYMGFYHRLIIGTGFYLGIVLFILLEGLIASQAEQKPSHIFIFQVILIALFLLFFYNCHKKSKYYIDKIEELEGTVLLSIYEYDQKLDSFEIPYADLLVDLKKNMYEKFPRYVLSIEKRSALSFKQYEIGYWNKQNLKKAYRLLMKKQE